MRRERLLGLALLGGVSALAARPLYRSLVGRLHPRVPLVHVAGESGRSILPRGRQGGSPARGGALASISVHGADRQFFAVTSPPRAGPLPLVLVFHGDGGTAASFHQAVPFETATGDGAIVLYPDGRGSTWDTGDFAPNEDIDFVRALIEARVKDGTADPTRVFLFGYSSGGFLANIFACGAPFAIKAFASTGAGAPYHQADSWPNGYTKCRGQRPVPALVLHGERDTGVTPDSGRFEAEYWAYVNHCEPGVLEPTAYDECDAFRGCQPDSPVVYCPIEGLGHWVSERSPEIAWSFFTHLR